VPVAPQPTEPFRTLIAAWLEREQRDNELVAGVEYDAELLRWYVRMRGVDKLVTTVWFTLRELTLHYETYFMPAPEENVAACYEYLLRVNQRLYACRFAVGAEDAVYLVGQLPLSAIDDEELDRVLGTLYATSEDCFATAMSLGYASRFRA
jgi:Putative bacterial sensory transduction regulator